jgi:hypothetical protein
VLEELQILICNQTDSLIHINLFPHLDKLDNDIYYRCSDIGGGFHLTEFDLSPNRDDILFYYEVLDIKPHSLTSQLFDSIHISFPDSGNTIIRFTYESVTGYSENIFSENSTWSFRNEKYDLPDNCGPNPVSADCYRFVISKNKLISE